MKYIKWKSLFISCFVCLLPIIWGLVLWERLPESMAIHFNMNNEADNFASKEFMVLGVPLIMAVLQIISCCATDLTAHKHGEQKKFERVTKWICPVVSVVLNVVTLGYNMGENIDIRRIAMLMVGILFVVTGNYMPKLDYIKNYNIDAEKARKINRFVGYETVIMGALMLVTLFLPPVASVAALFLLIPYVVVAIAYGIKVGRKDS